MRTTNVITHRATNGATVDLCVAHDGSTRRFIGVDYQGVSHGLHRGECAECRRHASGEADEHPAQRAGTDCVWKMGPDGVQRDAAGAPRGNR